MLNKITLFHNNTPSLQEFIESIKPDDYIGVDKRERTLQKRNC